jgi:hypothetical protein
VAPRCSPVAGDRDDLPVGEKEGERLGEVGSLKWCVDGLSRGGSGTSARRTPARCGRAASGHRGARWWLPVGEAPGDADASDGWGFPRTVSSDAGAVR